MPQQTNKKNRILKSETPLQNEQDLNKIKVAIEEQRIDRKSTALVSMAQYKNDTDTALYDNIQEFIDTNFDKTKFKGKQQITSGIVKYEDRTHKTIVIFEGQFEIIGGFNFNAKTEKVKDVLEERLVTHYLETSNPTIFINLKELATEIKTNAPDLRKRIVYILSSLETIKVEYKTKNKLKNVYEDFESLRVVSSSKYHSDTDIIEVHFDDSYAYKLATHNYFQLPKKYRNINDNSYPYAYHLAKYIFELGYYNKSKITFKTLYEKIKKIPRIEELQKKRNSPTQKIYEPLIKVFNVLNEQGDFNITFENYNFLLQNNSRKNLDFNTMLNTNIIINWINKPNYANKDKTKESYKKKIEKERIKQLAKAQNVNLLDNMKIREAEQ